MHDKQSAILVTGATGNIGSATVTALLTAGRHPRVFVRDPAKVPSTWAGLDVVDGDFADPRALDHAMTGIDRVLVLAPDGPGKVEHETAIIDAAARAHVAHVVKISAMRAATGSPLPCFDWHGQIEDHLMRSGLHHTNLRPAFFMENMLMVAPGVAAAGQIAAPTAGRATAMVASRDVAACAAAALASRRELREVYELTGPSAVTFDEVAAAIGRAIGREVRSVDLTPEEAQPRFEAGKPEWLAAHLSGVFRLIRDGGFARVTHDAFDLLGHHPQSIDDFAAEHVAAFLPVRAETQGTAQVWGDAASATSPRRRAPAGVCAHRGGRATNRVQS